jgi:hypothetical protein
LDVCLVQVKRIRLNKEFISGDGHVLLLGLFQISRVGIGL